MKNTPERFTSKSNPGTQGAELPRFVRDMLSSPPKRGEGLNNWFFRVARLLHAFRSHDEIVALLYSAVHGERLQRGEIERAVDRSYAAAWIPGEKPSAQAIAAPRWPEVNHEKRAQIIADVGIAMYDLWEASPIRFDDDAPHSEEVVDALFSGNPLLCCGESNSSFKTRPREYWRGKLSGQQFIVPSAMSRIKGLTQEGKLSEHTLDNTGSRMHLVVEWSSPEKLDAASAADCWLV